MDEEEETMNFELQSIIDIIQKNNVEEMLELAPRNQAETIDETEPENFLSLPNKIFQSREDVIGIVRKIAFMQGYAIVTKRSKTNRYVILGCDRGGDSRSTKIPLGKGKRKSASRKIGCPFEIWGKAIKRSQGLWKVEIKNLLHNHEPSLDMSGHPICRRFSEEEVMRIKQMNKAGVQPRQILSSLRQSNPRLLAISRNVYNITAHIRRENLAGRAVIDALMEDFGEGGFLYNFDFDQEGHLTHLFFAHPKSIELTKSYPDVFVMDCTYKTNKYKLPLLNIIGVTSFNTSFYSCFVFLQKEEESDYVWALKMFSKLLGEDIHPLAIISDREFALMNAINVVFPRTPNLLCVWHIEKNILAKCKSQFEEQRDWETFIASWNKLIWSPDESLFDKAWDDFQVEYKDYASVLNYIRGTWFPLKEKFVRAWTEQIRHFGTHVTSRAEGAHATLKKYLTVSTGGLQEVKDKICLAIEHQFQEIKTKIESEKLRVPTRLSNIPFFEELVHHVSFFALDHLYEQYDRVNSENSQSPCKGHFFKTMGLPCVHMIRDMEVEVMALNDIHKQWRIDTRSIGNDHATVDREEDPIDDLLCEVRDKYHKLPLMQKADTKRQLSQILGKSLPLLLEPTVQQHKGRPLGSKKRKESATTRRDPSQFELAEKSARKCSFCRQVGHDCRKCPLKVQESNMPRPTNTVVIED